MERKVFEAEQDLLRSLGMERLLRIVRRSSGGRKGVIGGGEESRGGESGDRSEETSESQLSGKREDAQGTHERAA